MEASTMAPTMARRSMAPLPRLIVEPVVRRALEEDLGRAGDLTSSAVIDADAAAQAEVVFRRGGRVCGVELALLAFALLEDPPQGLERLEEGSDVDPGTIVARWTGSARSLLGGERTFLNLVGRLSGIATATRDLVSAMGPGPTRLAETRKTTPGLRALEKYATRVGGAFNHRFGLDDAVMIKDNHIAVVGSLTEAVLRARNSVGHLVKVEVEIDRLEQLDEALASGADVILLDNMSPAEIRRAVDRSRGRVLLEASGGVGPDTVRELAATGVDVISMGWLTHSAPSLDVALELRPVETRLEGRWVGGLWEAGELVKSETGELGKLALGREREAVGSWEDTKVSVLST